MKRQRRSARLLGGLLAVFAGLVGWLAGSDLITLARSSAVKHATLDVSTGAAAALSAALAMMLIAAMAILTPGERCQRWLFARALISLSGVVLGPVALYLGTQALLPARGYRRCAKPAEGARFLTVRWVRHGARSCSLSIDDRNSRPMSR